MLCHKWFSSTALAVDKMYCEKSGTCDGQLWTWCELTWNRADVLVLRELGDLLSLSTLVHSINQY